MRVHYFIFQKSLYYYDMATDSLIKSYWGTNSVICGSGFGDFVTQIINLVNVLKK